MTEEEKEVGLFLEYQEKRKDNREKVAFYADQFTAGVTANKSERDDVEAAFNCYIGNQWPSEAVKILTGQGRPINTFNHVKPKIDKVAGQLILNPNEIMFSAQNQNQVSKTNIMTSLYEYDKNRSRYDRVKAGWIKDVLIHTGIMEMYIDYSHAKLGNISFRKLNRFTDVEFDPFWNTNEIKDARIIFKPVWYTARQIKENFDTKSEEVDKAINDYERFSGQPNFVDSLAALSNRGGEFWEAESSRYRVIECVYMQKTPYTKHYSKNLDRWLEENENPDTLRSQGDVIGKTEGSEDICKVMTICPGLDSELILAEGEHEIQVGRLPFIVRSADNTMGVRQGKVKGMQDAQITYNKRISMQTGAQTTSANGAMFVNEDAFKDKDVMKDFVQNRPVPGKTYVVASDQDVNKVAAPVPVGQMPEGLQQSIDFCANFMEMVVNDTDASSGRGGGANESGVLFESKKNQSQVAHVTVAEEVSAGEEEGAEMYFVASKRVYKGVERTFTNTATGMEFTINKRVEAEGFDKDSVDANYSYNEYLASNGQKEVMINDIANLPRHDVIIKRSELGLDQKQHNLAIFSELSQRSNNPMYQTVLQKSVNGLINVPADVLGQLNLTCDIQLELQMAQAKSQIAAMNMQAEQANLQLQQMQMQTQKMAQGGEEQGQPQQGEVQDQRQAANGPGQGNLAQGISNDQSNANNQAQSDF